jgi:hypothetical protein
MRYRRANARERRGGAHYVPPTPASSSCSAATIPSRAHRESRRTGIPLAPPPPTASCASCGGGPHRGLERAPAQAFANAARGDLTAAFLWLALLLGISEIGLASWWKRA